MEGCRLAPLGQPAWGRACTRTPAGAQRLRFAARLLVGRRRVKGGTAGQAAITAAVPGTAALERAVPGGRPPTGSAPAPHAPAATRSPCAQALSWDKIGRVQPSMFAAGYGATLLVLLASWACLPAKTFGPERRAMLGSGDGSEDV